MIMRKILFLYSEVMPYNVALFKSLTSADFSVDCIRWEGKQNKTSYQPSNVRNVRYIKFKDYLFKGLFKKKYDAVVISGWIDKKYVLLSFFYRLRGIKTICCIDTQHNQDKINIYKLIDKTNIFRLFYSNFWVPGIRQRKLANSLGYNDDSICDDFLAADTALFENLSPAFNNEKNRIDLLFVGRLVTEKGFDLLVDSVNTLSNTHNITLHVVGEGPLGDLVPNTSPHVKLYGFLSQSELCELLSEIDLFVLPSRYEPWGVVVHEMAAAGLPIITTKAVGASEKFVEDGRNGFIISTETSGDDLLNCLLEFFSMSRKRKLEMSNYSKLLAKRVNAKSAVNELLRIIY